LVEVYRPQNYKQALELMGEKLVVTLAGGTDLMVKSGGLSWCDQGLDCPALFIGHLEELKKVEDDGYCIRIGAACTYTQILETRSVPGVLKAAVLRLATPAIRNTGTIGGNICNASPAGDTLPVLYALDASVVLESINDTRTLPIEDFITGPGETVIKNDELLKEVVVPKKSFDAVFYRKVGTGAVNSLSKVSFTGLAVVEKGVVRDIRISFGAVAPTVVRSKRLENLFAGKNIQDIIKIIPELGNLYLVLIDPLDDQRSTARYRKAVSIRLFEYFLRNVLK
jgi:CO/xanthine dehydrogenase FAD-binding subunit